jgi:hypothetical protein
MTLFRDKAASRTADFNAGDVGYVSKTLGHYREYRRHGSRFSRDVQGTTLSGHLAQWRLQMSRPSRRASRSSPGWR